jgi:hypothetical protein
VIEISLNSVGCGTDIASGVNDSVGLDVAVVDFV